MSRRFFSNPDACKRVFQKYVLTVDFFHRFPLLTQRFLQTFPSGARVARALNPLTTRNAGVTKRVTSDKLKAPRAPKFAWTGWRMTPGRAATATREARLSVQKSFVLRANSCLVGDDVYGGRDADASLAEAESHLIGMGSMYYKYVRGVDDDSDLSRFTPLTDTRKKLQFDLGRDGRHDVHRLVTSIPLYVAHRRENPDATYTLLWCLSLCVGSKRVFLYALRSDVDQAVFPRMMHVEYPSGPSMSRAALNLFLAPSM